MRHDELKTAVKENRVEIKMQIGGSRLPFELLSVLPLMITFLGYHAVLMFGC